MVSLAKMELKIGDRVQVKFQKDIDAYHSEWIPEFAGDFATVIVINYGGGDSYENLVGLEFDNYHSNRHTIAGRTKPGHGYNMYYPTDFELVSSVDLKIFDNPEYEGLFE